jgi:hypothetical protein
MRIMMHIPMGMGDSKQMILEGQVDAGLVAQAWLDAPEVEKFRITEHLTAYTNPQDDTYEYNERVSYVMHEIANVVMALQGDVCILLEEGAGEALLR